MVHVLFVTYFVALYDNQRLGFDIFLHFCNIWHSYRTTTKTLNHGFITKNFTVIYVFINSLRVCISSLWVRSLQNLANKLKSAWRSAIIFPSDGNRCLCTAILALLFFSTTTERDRLCVTNSNDWALSGSTAGLRLRRHRALTAPAVACRYQYKVKSEKKNIHPSKDSYMYISFIPIF